MSSVVSRTGAPVASPSPASTSGVHRGPARPQRQLQGCRQTPRQLGAQPTTSRRDTALAAAHSKQPQQRNTGRGPHVTARTSSTELVALTEPLSWLDVDTELWEVLDMCSDEELDELYSILHGKSPFSPVVKSLVKENEPAMGVAQRGRGSIMHKVEARFRFLAADSGAVLRGHRPSYREALLAIRDRLDVGCSTNLSTQDLETELFVHILQNCVEYVATGEADASDLNRAAAAAHAEYEADGMASTSGRQAAAGGASGRANWTERLTAPFKFGLKDLGPSLLKFGSAVTVNAVGRKAAEQLGGQLLRQHLRYQAVAAAATSGAGGIAARGALGQWQRQAALGAAQRSLTAATAKYSAVRGALSFLGPVMWGWLAVDLALAAMGTDYARVIRAVFLLAQARLVRTQGFVNPSGDGRSGGEASHGTSDAGGLVGL